MLVHLFPSILNSLHPFARNSLSQSCTKKCIPPEYREGELNKGEGVCVDRCVSKFFEVNLKVGEKMQGDMLAKGGGGGGGGGGGMGGFGA